MTDYQIVQATGSNTAGQYNCNNVLHPTPDTRYSAKGLGSYLDISLKDKKPIGGISIAFFAGDRRKVKFTVASSDDGSNFKLIQTFASSGKTAGAEEFHFDKPVTAKTLRISFAGSFQTGVTFDAKALENLSSDTASFKCGIGVTGALQDHKGIDDGTVNDWFSVTQVAVLPSKLVEAIEKTQEADAKKHEQYEKELEKENHAHDSNCGCVAEPKGKKQSNPVDNLNNEETKQNIKAKEENKQFQKAGTAGGNAGTNKDGQVVSKADANQTKINQSAESNQAAVNKQGSTNPTSQNTSSSKPAGNNDSKSNFGLGSAQQNSETKNNNSKKVVKEGDKLDTTTTVNKKE